jgi:hypothetical protein
MHPYACFFTVENNLIYEMSNEIIIHSILSCNSKLKIAEMVSVSGLLLALPPPAASVAGASNFGFLYSPCIAMYWGSTLLAVTSGAQYLKAAWPRLSQ